MSATATDAPQEHHKAPVLLIFLLFCATALNYLDRQVLALLKPMLTDQFHWSDTDYAQLGEAFQYTAAASFLIVGWLVDRLGVRRALGIGVAVWSLAGMAHAFASTIREFVFARIALAAAETVGTPAGVKAAAVYMPVQHRSMMFAIGNAAPNVGTIIAPLMIPPFAAVFGWQAAFLVTGALGFVWLVFWILGTRNLKPVAQAPETLKAVRGAAPPIREIVRDRRTWAIIGAKPLSDVAWFFMLFWIPDFFHRQFGMTQATLGWPVALIYSLAACGALSSGFLFPALLRRGWSINRARKSSMFTYALIILPLPLALLANNPWVAALIIGIALFAHQGFSTNLFGLTADVIPSDRVATVIGAGAVAGNLAGAWIIKLSGWSLTNGHGYWPMFAICSCGYLLALGWVHLMVPNVRLSTDKA